MRFSWPGVVALVLVAGVAVMAHIWDMGDGVKETLIGLTIGLVTQIGAVGKPNPPELTSGPS